MSSVGLALCLGLALMPLACGGTKNPWAGGEPGHSPGEGPQAPKETVDEMTACLNSAKSRLTDTVYAMQFAVEVTESGHAGRVRFRDSSPSEPELEACIADALKGMSSPVPVMMLLPKEKAEVVSPASRGLLGQGWEEILGGGASLGPIFIVAAGVTLIVGLTLYITADTAEAARRTSKKKQQCLEWQYECFMNPKQPPWNSSFGDPKPCGACFRECNNHPKGEWPNYKCPRSN